MLAVPNWGLDFTQKKTFYFKVQNFNLEVLIGRLGFWIETKIKKLL
jgi:hypothetical protein